MTITDADGTVVGFKANSDARTAWRIDVRVRDNGGARRTEIEGQLIALNEAITPDRTLVELATHGGSELKTRSAPIVRAATSRRTVRRAWRRWSGGRKR